MKLKMLILTVALFVVGCGYSSTTRSNSTSSNSLDSSWTPSWPHLAAYWSLNESTFGTVNSGASDFADQGPVGTNYGTHSGTVTLGASGIIGNAVSFNHSGCITIPPAAGFNTTTLTAMAWFKTTSSVTGNIISFYNAASSFDGWALLLNNAGGHASFWGGLTNAFTDSVTGNLNDGNWHHFAVVANNTSLTLYLDGVVDQTTTIVVLPSYTGPGAIGADGDCNQALTGTLDEIAVWNTALSGADSTTIYNKQKSP